MKSASHTSSQGRGRHRLTGISLAEGAQKTQTVFSSWCVADGRLEGWCLVLGIGMTGGCLSRMGWEMATLRYEAVIRDAASIVLDESDDQAVAIAQDTLDPAIQSLFDLMDDTVYEWPSVYDEDIMPTSSFANSWEPR